MIFIDKGVPLPSGRLGSKYPFSDMEVGDSFVAEASKKSGIPSLAKRFGVKVTVRNIPGTTTVRVWRVA